MSSVPPPPPVEQGAPVSDARSARAEAKAAKARAKALRPWYRKKRFWLLGLVVVVIGVSVANSGGGDSKKPGDAAASSKDSATGQDVYTVGQTAKTDVFSVKLVSVENPATSSNSFDKPKDGFSFLAVQLEVTNSGSSQKTFSTLAGLSVIDSKNQNWNITIALTDRPSIEGTYQPGETKSGWATFEIPSGSTGLKLRAKGSLTATGSLFSLG